MNVFQVICEYLVMIVAYFFLLIAVLVFLSGYAFFWLIDKALERWRFIGFFKCLRYGGPGFAWQMYKRLRQVNRELKKENKGTPTRRRVYLENVSNE